MQKGGMVLFEQLTGTRLLKRQTGLKANKSTKTLDFSEHFYCTHKKFIKIIL